MIKPIVKDVFFLGQKSDPATNQDLQTGQDLHDTLKANESRCVGMAANMIRREETNHHCEHGIHEPGHVQSCDCEKRYTL